MEEAVIGPTPEQGEGGAVLCVDNHMKNALKEHFGNVEYVEWSPVSKGYYPSIPTQGPFWVVSLKLRLRNAGDDKAMKTLSFYIRHGQVLKIVES